MLECNTQEGSNVKCEQGGKPWRPVWYAQPYLRPSNYYNTADYADKNGTSSAPAYAVSACSGTKDHPPVSIFLPICYGTTCNTSIPLGTHGFVQGVNHRSPLIITDSIVAKPPIRPVLHLKCIGTHTHMNMCMFKPGKCLID